MAINKKQVMKKLSEVLDPELNIPITDLGLIYGTEIIKKKLKIKMTLTTIGCPLFALIETEVKNKMQEAGFENEDIDIQLTFDPPWSTEMLSERARAKLGL